MFRDVEAEWPLERMLRHLPRRLDLVIAEGFKNGDHPCLEVFRKAVSANLLSRGRENLLAVVGDDPGDLQVPRFHQDAIGAIGQFIIDHLMMPHWEFKPRRNASSYWWIALRYAKQSA
jgi:hypothetical protein